jgi:hypothetical protein
MTTSLQQYFVRADHVREKRVGPDVALYVESQRAIHVPNATARFIWECLAEPVTFDELLFMLAEAFETDADMLRTDLRETLEQFAASGLVRTETREHGAGLP